jgi:hypothetical protein
VIYDIIPTSSLRQADDYVDQLTSVTQFIIHLSLSFFARLTSPFLSLGTTKINVMSPPMLEGLVQLAGVFPFNFLCSWLEKR